MELRDVKIEIAMSSLTFSDSPMQNDGFAHGDSSLPDDFKQLLSRRPRIHSTSSAKSRKRKAQDSDSILERPLKCSSEDFFAFIGKIARPLLICIIFLLILQS